MYQVTLYIWCSIPCPQCRYWPPYLLENPTNSPNAAVYLLKAVAEECYGIRKARVRPIMLARSWSLATTTTEGVIGGRKRTIRSQVDQLSASEIRMMLSSSRPKSSSIRRSWRQWGATLRTMWSSRSGRRYARVPSTNIWRSKSLRWELSLFSLQHSGIKSWI